jgi:hypothetical protein
VRRGVSRSTLAWVALAVVGLVVAVSVSFAASQLSKPKVGLTSEPVPAVTELAPKSASSEGAGGQARPNRSPEHPAPTTTSPSPTTTTPDPTQPESDDEGDGDDD